MRPVREEMFGATAKAAACKQHLEALLKLSEH
jgi:hypothetical protein